MTKETNVTSIIIGDWVVKRIDQCFYANSKVPHLAVLILESPAQRCFYIHFEDSYMTDTKAFDKGDITEVMSFIAANRQLLKNFVWEAGGIYHEEEDIIYTGKKGKIFYAYRDFLFFPEGSVYAQDNTGNFRMFYNLYDAIRFLKIDEPLMAKEIVEVIFHHFIGDYSLEYEMDYPLKDINLNKVTSDFMNQGLKKIPDFADVKIVVDPDSDTLYSIIEKLCIATGFRLELFELRRLITKLENS